MKVALQIRDSAREPVVTQLELTDLALGKRVGRALSRLALLWVLAVCSVLVPLLHFVLVPGFFISGLVLAVLAFRDTVVLVSPRLVCPKCGLETDVEAGSTGWPLSLQCTHCGTTFFAKPIARA